MKSAIGYNQVKNIILGYSHRNPIIQARTRAMLGFQYVLACRYGELITYRHKQGYETIGLVKSQIKEYPKYWEVTLPNFKQGKIEYGTGFILKDSGEDWLRDICMEWVAACPTEQLFKIHQSRAKDLCSKALAPLGLDLLASTKRPYHYNTHHLRRSRADHLLKLFNFSILDVQKTLRHKFLSSTQSYIDSSLQERIDKLQNAKFQGFGTQ